jgi:mono/diheme cytochrome c family protein
MKKYSLSGYAILAALAFVMVFAAAYGKSANAGQEEKSKSSDAAAGNAENGKRLFTKYGCYECHGREGQGSTMAGPRIGPDPVPLSVMLTYVRKPTGEMPPYTDKVVSDKDLADIHAFLESLPHPPPVKSIPLLNQ